MLPAAHRLTDAPTYRRAARRGRRATSRTLTVSLLRDPVDDGGPPPPARVGLVVSRAVGGSVRRNQVKRRLRHLAAARLARLPQGSVLVLRALPAAATASSSRLGADLDRCLGRVTADVSEARG